MPTTTEKAAFTKRLEFALRRSPESVQGATELALRFNLRHQGNAISPQTAHKWLTGRAIPTNDKLATIAKWLNVDQHWLHYGPAPLKPASAAKDVAAKNVKKPPSELINLAAKIQELPPHRRYLVEELVEQLQQEIG
ncbi:transcriptional regulator [Collimonas sp. OK412]|jgi:transcriptional regulator with XRE-family HTH domain|uniref:transcriptional regulator n=1 Tax=Collimonas sp. (strain OK412) TaxID=1801619 RepID=UPI000B89283D|nr:transcriptional regulator [Collimonas sp. OK412]